MLLRKTTEIMKPKTNSVYRLSSKLVGLLWVIGGVAFCTVAQSQTSEVGQWSAVQNWPVVAIHIHVLPNGKLLVWPRDGGAQARIWDPATGAFTQVPLSTMNLFCTGHAFLPDGRLMVTGGHIRDGAGEIKAHIFDYRDNSWTRVADMNNGRWYPTSTALGNGESLVISGSTIRYRANPLPQVWQTSGGWRSLTSASLEVPLYPFMHQAPNGKVFNSGPNTVTRYLDTSGTGAWTDVASRSTYRDYGSSVQYAPGKIVVIGGGDPPTRTAEVIDLNQPSPSWRAVGQMSVARRQMNATLLPDGTILVTGGTSGAGFNDACNSVFLAELWNPVTEQFTSLASAAERRLYHSTSILLPDGRVLNGGGGQPSGENCSDADHLTVQFFSPPYLFKGARPTISSAPGSVTYGQTFFVGTANGSSIARVNWVRLGSVTHAFDQNQSFNQLSFAQASGGLNVSAPANPNACPPGHYMLFIVDGNGVPSVASILQIVPSSNPPPAPTGLVAQGGPGLVNLSWNAAPSASAYNVKRSTVNGGPYATIAPNVTSTTYTDSAVTGGTAYHYVVSALNAAGESPNSAQASATPSSPPPPGSGTGLKGQYYNNIDFTSLRVTRTDPTVNFNWGTSSPAAGIQGDTFSVRWTGEVQPQFSETYSFHTVTDDGVRLWVNGQQLINDWTNHAATENSGTISLIAGQRYIIQMDYFENTGSASAQLLWSSTSQIKQIIPQTQLYPAP
jgi:hypothetical protein